MESALPRPEDSADQPVDAVGAIIDQVRREGDRAVRELTQRFDRASIDELRVPSEAIERAIDDIDRSERAALELAHQRISTFHERTRGDQQHRWSEGGVTITGRRVPVDRAGAYVPGGRARYPSTVLMTAVPARVAGVTEIALCVPPDESGLVASITLAAAAIAGVDEVYRIGGAQAIAALAYGTESIRPVDVIVGPGNVYVALAKRAVAGVVGVPSAFAGPSEVVVVADESAPATYAAMDLLVQAEHGPGGLAWLVTWSESMADAVSSEIERLLADAPRRDDMESTLRTGGYLAIVDGPSDAMRVVNRIAPEHLQLMTSNPDELVELVRHAGAVFTGPLSPASIGDYVAGPSHVLPTFGSARYAGALTTSDFEKQLHVISVDGDGLAALAPHVEALALAEGLPAHAQSVSMRLAR